MSLKIRRGTDSERVTITPAEGELIYTTDTKLLYVGDGTTSGGRVVTASGGGGTGFTGSQGDVGFTGSKGLQGDVGFVGSASTVQGPIGYTGSATRIPTGGNTGQVLSKASGTDYDVSWSTISGGGGSNGGTLTSNLVLSTYNITGTNLTINGSTGSITTDTLSISKSFNARLDNINLTKFIGRFNGGDIPSLTLESIRGTFTAPEVLNPGDFGVSLNFSTYDFVGGFDNGKSLVSFIPMMDSNANKTDSAPASMLYLLVGAGDGNGSDPSNNYSVFTFNKNGIFNSKIVQHAPLTTIAVNGISPSEGMIVFDTTLQKFKGYVSDTGKAGGGAPNSTPGWVNLN